MANEKGNLHFIIIKVKIKGTLLLFFPPSILLLLFPDKMKGPALTRRQGSAADEFLIRGLNDLDGDNRQQGKRKSKRFTTQSG